MTLTVFLLDYQRFSNILEHILPSLFREECVSQIVVCHGSYAYEEAHHEKFPHLQHNEIRIFEWEGKQILRIQDPLNEEYQCYRRWVWIEKLSKQGLLQNDLVLTHDDDYLFRQGEIPRLMSLWKEKKGICICGSGGRDYSLPQKYSFRSVNGPCRIAVGQSMLLSISSVIEVSHRVSILQVPLDILHEDDIVVSLLLGKGNPVHFGIASQKIFLPSPNARWHRKDHIAKRNATADWILSHLSDAL